MFGRKKEKTRALREQAKEADKEPDWMLWINSLDDMVRPGALLNGMIIPIRVTRSHSRADVAEWSPVFARFRPGSSPVLTCTTVLLLTNGFGL